MSVQSLPAVFTSLNCISFLLIISAYIAVKMQKKGLHGALMISALTTSSLFLVLYLFYHFNIPEPKRYQGTGIIRSIYFTILISHTLLAAVIVPMIGFTVYHAILKNHKKHKKIAKFTLPIWIYVSFTGIVIYLMLYVF
ncbi:MAG: DUF420 domain-containing protein [Spirochaetia bacterium]|nr:DUF420 domain-containing protein [Spirochaetia bacterium]